MPVTYVVVTPYLLLDMFLVLVVVQMLPLLFLDKDHNSYDLQYQSLHPLVTTIPIVLYDY